MKKYFWIFLIAGLIAAVVLGYGLYKIVDHSNHYQIVITIDKGDEMLDVRTLEAGQTLLVPEVPEKEGKTFKGWYADPEGRKEFDFDKPIRYDTTIYALWE